MKSKFLGMVLVTTVLSAQAGAVFAQALPGAVDPSRVDQRYRAPAQPSAPMAPVEAPQAAPAAAQADAQQFQLGAIEVKGTTVYGPDAFRGLYSDMIGKNVSVADVQHVAEAIGREYRKAGYVLARVFVPNQTVGANGVITIQVNEGYVSNIVYEGDPIGNRLRTLTQWYALKIKDSKPLKTSVLERYLLLINDLPGKSVQAVLRPTNKGDGSNDLVIFYSEDRFQGSYSVDNRNSRYVGPWQHSAALTFNNVLGFDERTTIRGITTSPQDELRFVDIQQEHQVGTEGTKLTLVASHAETKPSEELAPLDIRGRSESIGATVSHPFIRSRVQNLTAHGTVDMRNTRTRILGTQFSEDLIRSVRAGATYDVVDRYKGINVVSSEISQGLDFFGANDDGVGRSRVNGYYAYTKVNFDASRVQALPYKLSLYTGATAQYAFDPLLATEQFTIGGPAFGTFYDPAELSGDHGIAGKLELRYGDAPGRKYLDSYQFYGYYDIGTVWLKDALVGEDDRTSLASVGLGVRANITPMVSTNVEYAVPLTKKLGANPDTDGRVFGGLNVRF